MYNLSRICYLCLKDLMLNQLCDEDSKNGNVEEAILFILPELIILQPESLVRVCSTCKSTIIDFYNYKKLCLANNATLWSTINKIQKPSDYQKLDTCGSEEETDNISEPTTEAVTSSENPNHTPFTFECKQEICDDDSDSGELFENSAESIPVLSDEDISVENIADNSETVPCKNKKDIVNKKKKQKDIKEFKCFDCNRIFKRKSNLNLHMKIHKNIRDFQCSICEKGFLRKIDLKDHMYVHSDTKHFECSVCNKKFTQSCSLRKHIKIHTDCEYECADCNKKFKLKNSYNRHKLIHDGVRNFECEICNWKFLRKFHLINHMKKHSGTKDFECSFCNKKFIHRVTLTRHMKIHTGTKDCECSVCHKTFLRKDYLKLHLNRKHGVVQE